MLNTKPNTEPFSAQENPAAFPRAPAIEAFHAPVKGMLGERIVLAAERGMRLLQWNKAPVVFLPPSAVVLRHVRPSDTARIDEFGLAVYLHLASNGVLARDALWYYPGMDPEYAALSGMLCVAPAHLSALWINGRRVTGSDSLPGAWNVEPAGSRGAA